MTRIEPHNFSRSPVQEVFCTCTFESEEPLSLRVLAPYPGWISIKKDIWEILEGMPDSIRVTGCTLQYTDIFHPSLPDESPGSCFPDMSDNAGLKSRIIGRRGDDFLVSSPVPGSEVVIRHKKGGKTGLGATLIFTVVSSTLLLSVEEVLNWFDTAHDEIHHLFDLCVPPELIRYLM